jgi:hypothetical protein
VVSEASIAKRAKGDQGIEKEDQAKREDDGHEWKSDVIRVASGGLLEELIIAVEDLRDGEAELLEAYVEAVAGSGPVRW